VCRKNDISEKKRIAMMRTEIMETVGMAEERRE
jgi:hypothetical protein